MEARSTPLAAEFPMPGCRQACLIDSSGPFPEFTDSDIMGPGSLNHSGMSYHDSTSPPSYCDNHHPLNSLEENPCPDSDCLSNDHSHHYSGTMRASLPDETALFVANYLHQLGLKFGMDMTLDRVIQICIGQWDTPGHWYYHHLFYRLHCILSQTPSLRTPRWEGIILFRTTVHLRRVSNLADRLASLHPAIGFISGPVPSHRPTTRYSKTVAD
ncbi:uncharacterized protein HD556DRAFT_247374 [Suillus plorans]|uniref:Uncharacterized protein n=1 Tax=Suillus plorans TaxID=116603 RepID=A0A9P7DLN2_9AGAM|nr:uncharacterized protein HD556DRAFT_247374 [Suillus plorans]KAG1797875.1 hypothetical protein HD556DRAFT_247374 [Suillus plorans]